MGKKIILLLRPIYKKEKTFTYNFDSYKHLIRK